MLLSSTRSGSSWAVTPRHSSTPSSETYIRTEGFELLRLLLQDHLDLHASKEVRVAEATDASAVPRKAVERGHERPLTTIVGTVVVGRLACRRRARRASVPPTPSSACLSGATPTGCASWRPSSPPGGPSMRPADAIDRATGVSVARRQVEGLAQATAIDLDAFYETDARPAAGRAEVVVISADAKGVVMRPDSLSEAKSPKIGVSVVVGLAHVPEYLRGAPWSLFVEGGPAAEEWVGDKALAVLNGSRAHAGLVVVSTEDLPPQDRHLVGAVVTALDALLIGDGIPRGAVVLLAR